MNAIVKRLLVGGTTMVAGSMIADRLELLIPDFTGRPQYDRFIPHVVGGAVGAYVTRRSPVVSTALAVLAGWSAFTAFRMDRLVRQGGSS